MYFVIRTEAATGIPLRICSFHRPALIMVSAPQLYPDGNTSFSLYEDDGVTRQVSANVRAIEAPLVLPVVTRVCQSAVSTQSHGVTITPLWSRRARHALRLSS